jgi:hypothetical protein
MMRRLSSLHAAFAAALAAAVPEASVALGDTKIEAGSCSVAAAGSASDNTFICNVNMPPEKLKELIEAAAKGGEEPLLELLVQVSKTLGVTENAARTLLRIVGENSNVPYNDLAAELTRVAGDYKRLQVQVAALNPEENPAARKLVDEARPEIDAGHFERARELLRQATRAQIDAAQEARKLKERARAAEDAQMLGATRSAGAEGNIALIEGRYVEAADLFAQAAAYVPDGYPSQRRWFLLGQAHALSRQGYDRGDNVSLQRSMRSTEMPWRNVRARRLRSIGPRYRMALG